MAPDVQQRLVIFTHGLIARQTVSRLDIAITPRHVSAVERPYTSGARHLFTVIDHWHSDRRHLDGRTNSEFGFIPVQVVQRHRSVSYTHLTLPTNRKV